MFFFRLSHDDRFENAVKQYFFGFIVGNRVYQSSRQSSEIQNSEYAFGDETWPYDQLYVIFVDMIYA